MAKIVVRNLWLAKGFGIQFNTQPHQYDIPCFRPMLTVDPERLLRVHGILPPC